MSVQDIENLYPLSPLQQGLLFHGLYESEGGLYVDQFVLELEGDLDVQLLERAWQQVVDRHAILRTSFHWEKLDKPLQIVHQRRKISPQVYDLREQSPDAQQEQIEHYLEQDRRRGFDFSEAPLMRLTLFQLSGNAYQLVWSSHHIILDGWSGSILRHELLTGYEALRRGETPAIEPGPPFSNYISWLSRQDTSEAEAFWHEKLKGFSVPASLSRLQAPRRVRKSEQDKIDHTIYLSEELTSALKSFARRHQLTLNTLAQGAWGLLLSHYTGQSDVVFGVTVSGRPEVIAGIESMVGNLINTLPFRVQISPGDTVLPWLKKLRAAQVELHSYEYTPLPQIQKWSEAHGGEPLFESVLVFENVPRPDVALNGNASVLIHRVRHLYKTNYPLTIQVAPGEQLSIRAVADHQHLESSFITRMLSHFEVLLDSLITHPEQQVANLLWMTTAEIHQLLTELNETVTSYPRHSSLQELFERQAASTPDAVSVIFEDQELTYVELNSRANQLAHHLRSLSVGTESLVGLCVEPSLEMVVGMLGILKAGGVCVPLNPAYPQERLAFMIEDTACSVCLTQQRLVKGLRDLTCNVVCLDMICEITARQSKENIAGEIGGERLAYVMYTSGSTGIPKGVEVSHRGIIRLLSEVGYVQLGPTETFLQLSDISFDASFFEIWGALLYGGRCVLPPDKRLAVEDLGNLLNRHGVSVLWLTSSMFNVVVDKDSNILSGVRQLIIGGESLSVPHVKRALESLPRTQITNGYGPTEGTTFTCCYRLPR